MPLANRQFNSQHARGFMYMDETRRVLDYPYYCHKEEIEEIFKESKNLKNEDDEEEKA
jgi:hypothetical protein